MYQLFTLILFFVLIMTILETNTNNHETNSVNAKTSIDINHNIYDDINDNISTINLIDTTQITNSLHSNNNNILSKMSTFDKIHYIIVGIFMLLFLLS